jgi:hypothetical protein
VLREEVRCQEGSCQEGAGEEGSCEEAGEEGCEEVIFFICGSLNRWNLPVPIGGQVLFFWGGLKS